MARLDEDIRDLRRQLKLEHRKRDNVENEFQDRSATILNWKDKVTIGHHQSVRRVAKTA